MNFHESIRSLRLILTLFIAVLFVPAILHATDSTVDLSAAISFTKGDEFPGAEGSSKYDSDSKTLILNYDFNKGGQYVAVTGPMPETGKLSTIKIGVTGPGGGLTVALSDSTGQTLLFRLGMIESGKQTMQVPLDKPSDGYGGASDKILHYPIKSIRLTVEKAPPNLQGKLAFTSITLSPATDPAAKP